jgi:hypothetical protein
VLDDETVCAEADQSESGERLLRAPGAEDGPILDGGQVTVHDGLAESALDQLLVGECTEGVVTGASLGLAERMRAEHGVSGVERTDGVGVTCLPTSRPSLDPVRRRCPGIHGTDGPSGHPVPPPAAIVSGKSSRVCADSGPRS